jgi:hypothetical protein
MGAGTLRLRYVHDEPPVGTEVHGYLYVQLKEDFRMRNYKLEVA